MSTKDPKPLAVELRTIVADLGIREPRPLDDDAYWSRRDAEVADARAAEARREAASRRSLRLRVLADNGFPALALEAAATIDAGAALSTAAVERALEFAEGRRRALSFGAVVQRSSLVLAGGTGAGKTSAAAWLALVDASREPGMVGAGDLEARGAHSRRELRGWLQSRTMLVVDDLGCEHEPSSRRGAFRSLIGEVVEMFHAERRPLVITTNLLPRAEPPRVVEAQFVERYGERVWSRLAQSGVWANCGAEDLRRRRP